MVLRQNFWFSLPIGLVGLLTIVGVLLHLGAGKERNREAAQLTTLPKTITLSSGSFPPHGDMPVSCSCRGVEASPALSWEGSRPNTRSYVVLMTDYDVPTPRFSLFNLPHWVVYNLPASVRSLPEGVTAEQMRMLDGKIGKHFLGDPAYAGPCPPVGRHAYVFRVYALDRMLAFAHLPDKQDVLAAMQGHVLSYGELTGYFQ